VRIAPNGEDTLLSYIAEFDFKSSIPRKMIMSAAPIPHTENLMNLRSLLKEGKA
jgi:hypothetical protein